MIKGVHKATVPIDEMQHTADVDLFERIEAGMVDQLSAPGIVQGPPGL
jgi:hypothetical protein